MKKLVIVLIVFLSLSQCKPDGPHYKLNDEIKEWVDFKEDTWWLYEDEITGKQDCLSVYKNEAATWYDEVDKRIKESGDYIWLYIDNTDTTRQTFMSASANRYGNYFSGRETDIYYGIRNEGSSRLLRFDTLLLDTSHYKTKTYILNKYDAFTLNNMEFKNVVHVSCEIVDYNADLLINQGYNAINEFWIAKYEGVIKKILRNPYDTTIWVLQDYEIIKDWKNE